MISNKLYDTLRWACQLVIPALATLYFALAGIWSFPYANEIVGSLMALGAFLGVLLGLNATVYMAQKRIYEIETAQTTLHSYSITPEGIEEEYLYRLPDETYLILKWVTITVFPGLATLYGSLSSLWNLPFSSQVVGTIAALAAFMGLMLGVSSITPSSR